MKHLGELKCTICLGKHLVPFEERVDKGGRIYELSICRDCFSIINMTDLRAACDGFDVASHQSAAVDSVYRVDESFLSQIDTEIDILDRSFIQLLFVECPEIKRNRLLDFGAGRGLTAIAASRYFETVFAVDLNFAALQTLQSTFGIGKKIRLADSLDDVPDDLDVALFLHVIEHLPDANSTLQATARKLRKGGALLFQVPLMKMEYLMDCHYTFLNRATVDSISTMTGLMIKNVMFDHKNDFMTCIMIK
jgi:SAM-dependent methyltransferase